jgi:hypothetical protein
MSENIVYELLENPATAVKVLDSVKEDTFWLKEWMSDNTVINGDVADYYSSNPAAGNDYKGPKKGKGQTDNEDTVYKCSVPKLFNKLFKTTITPDMLRIATGSPEKAEMIAALQANNLKKQLGLEISEACVKFVCKKENFADESYIEMEEADFKDAGKFLKKIFEVAELAKHATDRFNKGRKKKDGSYVNTVYASGSLKNQVIILNTNYKTNVRFESAKTYNYSLINLKEEFKSVYDAILPDKVGALVLSEESIGLNWQIQPKLIVRDHPDDPLSKQVSLPGFVVGGPISFANMMIIVKRDAKVSSTTGTKDLLKDYVSLTDNKSANMTKSQAKEWNNFGLTYEQVKDWLSVGFESGDAKFVNWMINVKAKSETKFSNYSDPAWCLNNLGTSPNKSVADLIKEAGNL